MDGRGSTANDLVALDFGAVGEDAGDRRDGYAEVGVSIQGGVYGKYRDFTGVYWHEVIRHISGPSPTAPSLSTAPASAPENSTPAYLLVKDETKSVRVDLAQIQYIEGLKDYVRIHTPDKKITTLQSLKS